MSDLIMLFRYLCVKILASLFRRLVRLVDPPPKSKPDGVLAIPSRDKGRSIKAHVYQPQGDASTTSGARPVLLNFFGGGFVLPLHGADDLFCRRVATEAGYVVLDVEYRLSPEHAFPAAIHDAEDVAKYVLDRADHYKASQISVSGFSSGGTCALALIGLFPRDTFRSLITFYPSTNMAQDPAQRVAPVPGGKRLPVFWTRIFRRAYVGEADAQDPRISPINADTSPYPSQMLMITAEMDTSAIEAETLAGRAAENGRNVVVQRMTHVGHNFDKKPSHDCVRAREEAYGLAVDMLRDVATPGQLAC